MQCDSFEIQSLPKFIQIDGFVKYHPETTEVLEGFGKCFIQISCFENYTFE